MSVAPSVPRAGPSALLGIDLGTTGAKALLLDANSGSPIATGYRSYPTSVTDSRQEQDPNDWWQATVAAVRSCKPWDYNVLAVGLSGHMHSLVLVDQADEVVRPAMTWADRRSTPQVLRLRSQAELFAARCANPVVEAFTAPKLAWVAEHEPATLQRSSRLVLAKDVLRFRLTGTWGTDRTDAWGTLLYDIHTGDWDEALFELCGADPSLGQPVHAPDKVVGGCVPDVAAELGLPPDTPIVAGASDVACSALGIGALDSGVLAANLGTAAQIMAPLDVAAASPLFFFGRADGPGGLGMASIYAAGLSIDWAAGLLLNPVGGSSGRLLDELAAMAKPADGPVFVPHLLGTSVPTNDESVRGGFLGLDPTHDRATLARSVFEGVAHACLFAVQHVASSTHPLSRLRIAGGPTRSTVLCRTIAANAHVPVERVEGDASPTGAAMLAGVGIGRWGDYAEAAGACVKATTIHPPSDREVDRLRRGARTYRAALATVEAFSKTQGEAEGHTAGEPDA